MITAPSSDDNDNAQLFTLLDCQINITRPVHSALFVAWLDLESGHKWEYRDRNSTSVKCVAAPGRVKPKSQQARGRERNDECDPSWAHHYCGQGTHDTASTIYKLSQVPLSSGFAPLTLTSFTASLSCVQCPPNPPSHSSLTAGTATSHHQPSD